MNWREGPLLKIVFEAPKGFVILDACIVENESLTLICYNDDLGKWKKFITYNGVDFAEIISDR